MKKILVIFFVFYSILAFSQICYTYDAASNRIKRQTCAVPLTHEENNELKQLIEKQSLDLRIKEVGITDLSDLIIYPNPTSGNIRLINQETMAGALLQVMTVSGEMIQTIQVTQNDIDLSKLTSGSYFLILVSDKSRNTAKLLITK